MNKLKNTSLFFLITGLLFLGIQEWFFEPMDENGVLNDTILIPLSLFFCFVGVVLSVIYFIARIFKK